MERKNVMLDEATIEAAEYLMREYHLVTVSAALRYAVQELAKRGGWRSGGAPPKRIRSPRRRHPAQGEAPDA